MSKKFRGARYLLCLGLLLGLFGGLFGGHLVLAAEEASQALISLPLAQEEPPPEEPVEERLEVYSRFPILQNTVGSIFEFEVTLYYEGSEARTFDLDLVAPEGWIGIFLGGYPETEISAFTVEPGKAREAIQLFVGPAAAESMPEPGDYVFTVRAFSDDVAASVDLEAVVVPLPPQYLLYLATSTLRREFQVKPNEENHVSIQLNNAQIGTVNNIIFSAEKPEGWDVTFTPSTLASLEPGVTQEIDVVITPPAGTEAGDYPVVLIAAGDEAEMARDLRITVVTATNVGAVGIGIAVGVIVALAIWFRRAGRRGAR